MRRKEWIEKLKQDPRVMWNGHLYWYEGGIPATDEEARIAERILDVVKGGPMSIRHLDLVVGTSVVNIVWRMISSGYLRLEEGNRVALRP